MKINDTAIIIAAAVLCVGAVLSACAPLFHGKNTPTEAPEPTTAPELSGLNSLSYSHSGTSTDDIYTYTFERTDSATHVTADCYCGYVNFEVDLELEVLDRLTALLNENEVALWDGFNKSDSSVLDGSGFTFEATFADGTSINAHGSNSFPKNFQAVASGLKSIFDEVNAKAPEEFAKYFS